MTMKKTLTIVMVAVIALACIAAIAPNSISKAFDSGAVAVTDASNYVEVIKVQAEGRPILIQVTVGAGGAIAHLRIQQAVVQGGAMNVLAEDTDFNSPSVAMPYVLGSTVYQTAANGTFQVKLDSGAADYCVCVKKATTDTTVRVIGRAL
jgi:hypothetical protein